MIYVFLFFDKGYFRFFSIGHAMLSDMCYALRKRGDYHEAYEQKGGG